MKKRQVLLEAQKSGTIVKVIYKIGSQPNHAREIIPLKIEGEKVYAKCLNSKSEKIFQIDKLRLLTDQEYANREKWDSNIRSLTDYEMFVIEKERRKKIMLYIALSLSIVVVLSVVCLILTKKM